MSESPIINFSVEKNLSRKEQQEVTQKVRALSGVFNVHALAPESRNEDVKTMYYARLDQKADVQKILSDISAIPGVARASLPAPRRLF